MKCLDDNVYLDMSGRKHVKVRDVGYKEFAYLKEDGTHTICGGFVGLSAGWKKIDINHQSKEDLKFRIEIMNSQNSLEGVVR